jgi:hypothetical protein
MIISDMLKRFKNEEAKQINQTRQGRKGGGYARLQNL